MISPFFVYLLYVLLISACLGMWAKKLSNARAITLCIAWSLFVVAFWMWIGV